LNKELGLQREYGRVKCKSSGNEFNKADIYYKNKDICWENNLPDQDLSFYESISNEEEFNKNWEEYEYVAEKLLPYYQHLGLLLNYNVKNGIRDYEVLRQRVQYNIKF
jgi:hypothetical protein